jgi:hypothetical protein
MRKKVIVIVEGPALSILLMTSLSAAVVPGGGAGLGCGCAGGWGPPGGIGAGMPLGGMGGGTGIVVAAPPAKKGHPYPTFQ